jgi:cobalamin biosynthesis protein CobT
MSFTVEQKNLLTKLMASENLTVEHQKIHTAKFDPVNRVLYLPIWQDMAGFMYDHLGGHEVGHALYTPADGWHDVASDNSKGKNFKSFLNVVEDARIEKKVTRKFPGLKTSFRKGFQELLDRDFFGIKYSNVNDLSFIERLNLYTKSQYSAEYIKFTTEEMVYVLKVQNLETWEDVLALTGEIYDYSKDEQFDKQLQNQMRDFEMFDMDNEGDYSDSDYDYDYDDEEGEDGQPEKGKNSKSSDEKSEEKTENAEGSSNSDETENDDYDELKSEPDFDRFKKSAESDRDQFSPECRTDDSYRQNESSLLDEKCKPYLYLDIPSVNAKNVFTPAKRVQELLSDYYAQRITDGGFDNAYVQKLVTDFKNKNDRYVGLLAKEFEMRKAAKAFSKSKLSDTGDIDINKLCNYKFDDNIFRKVMLVPKGKSHGLILLLDCSGSMSDNMAGSIEQILVLSMFCRKVNIPFAVYGFTDSAETYQIDRNSDKWTNRKANESSFSRKAGELGFSNVQLREYINSKMSNVEFTKSLRNLILLKESYVRNRGQYNRIGRPESENLCNTPLVQAVFAVGSILNNFRTTNNLDITSLVIVHDGDADNAAYYNVEVERQNNEGDVVKYVYGYGFDVRSSNIVIRDRKNKFEYAMKMDNKKNYSYFNNEELLRSALEWIRVVGKTKVFGFFILASRSSHSKSAIRGRYYFEDGSTIEEMRKTNAAMAFETEKALIKKFKEQKFLISNTKGYNSFYLISGGSELQTQEEEIEINGTVTSHKLKTAFMKMSKKKQVNRVLVSKFIQGMAV